MSTTRAPCWFSGEARVVDARSATRFTGETPNLAPAALAMPGAANAGGTGHRADGTLKIGAMSSRSFGVDLGKPIVTSCGSGVTASVLALASALTGPRSMTGPDRSAAWLTLSSSALSAPAGVHQARFHGAPKGVVSRASLATSLPQIARKYHHRSDLDDDLIGPSGFSPRSAPDFSAPSSRRNSWDRSRS